MFMSNLHGVLGLIVGCLVISAAGCSGGDNSLADLLNNNSRMVVCEQDSDCSLINAYQDDLCRACPFCISDNGRDDIVAVNREEFDDYFRGLNCEMIASCDCTATTFNPHIVALCREKVCTKVVGPAPDERYLTDPLYCEQDADCAYQPTEASCRGCNCPYIVNVYNYETIQCSGTEDPCDFMCPYNWLGCLDSQCQAASVAP